jgi:hypothetical protein
VLGPYKGVTPTAVSVRPSLKVPGAGSNAETLFDVCQILTWLAKERRDLQEQLEWREQVPELMAALTDTT